MSFYAKLTARLVSLSDSELRELPRGYQIVGRILILKLKPRLVKHRRLIGSVVLGMFPYIQTVCLAKDIGGVKRKPKVEVIAGCRGTLTTNTEHGCRFLLDVAKVMWSQGNKEEKMRLARLVRPKETVVDMFAGIGYFSIVVAKHAQPRKIYAIDINPNALEFLRRNIWLNGVEDKIEILQGDCRRFAGPLEGVADRVLMGYLFDTEKFLPYAFRMAKRSAFIHLHRTAKLEEIACLKRKIISIGKKNNVSVKVLKVNEVKSYAPNVAHVVFDLKIKKL